AQTLDGGMLKEDPAIEAELRTTLANTWSNLGRAPEAAAQYARAAELDRVAYGADAPATLRSEALHAHACCNAGETAHGIARRADVAARCERLAPASPQLALALELLGDDLIDDERAAEAVAPLRRCLELREHAKPVSRYGVASALNAVGVALAESGAAAEAESLLRRSLEMRRAEGAAVRPDAAAQSAATAR